MWRWWRIDSLGSTPNKRSRRSALLTGWVVVINVITSTLLVPGYIDAEEVGRIAEFIANLNPDIPYALLGFHPNFFMDDLPYTSSRHASEALEAARTAGLRNIRLGNVQLFSNAYYPVT